MARAPPPPLLFLRGHKSEVTALCFLPAGIFDDGALKYQPSLVSGSKGEIFVWNLKINRVAFQLSGHNGKMILCLHYIQNSILSQGRDGYINIWNYSDGSFSISRKFPSPEIGFCLSSVFIKGQDVFLTITGRGKSVMEVTDYNTGQIVTEITPADDLFGSCMCIKVFDLQLKMCALCGYENGSLVLWDCQTNSIVSSLTCHKEPLFCLDFDPHHRSCGVSGSAEDILQVWKVDDMFQLTQVRQIKLTNPGVNVIAIRPDGKILLTGGWDGAVRVFSWKTLKPLAVLNFHKSSILSLRFAPEPIDRWTCVFAIGSKDNSITLWTIYGYHVLSDVDMVKY